MSYAVIISKNPRSDTYDIKGLLKLNGFKWAHVAKLWYITADRKAKALKLLEVTKLHEKYEICDVSEDQLFINL
jgi:hypothetical protein